MLNLHKDPLLVFNKSLRKIAQVQRIVIDLQRNDIYKRDEKISFLYSCYVLYLIALWETFIRTLAKESANEIVKRKSYPESVLRNLANKKKTSLKNFKSLPESEIIEEYNEYITRKIENFNSARPDKIDKLFALIIGYENLSDSWKVKSLQLDDIKFKINSIITIRGSVAHGVFHNNVLSFEENFTFMEFVYDLAISTQNLVNNHFDKHMGSPLY